MSLFGLCLKDLKHHPKFLIIFVLNAALGLIGLMAVENFRTTFNNVLEARSKQMLGADLSVSARQALNGEDLERVKELLPEGSVLSRAYGLFSMAAYGERSRLVSLRTLSEGFPYYGGFKFAGGESYPESIQQGPEAGEVWVYPEVVGVLGAELGESLKIGNEHFQVTRVIEEDSLQAFQQGAMAPRVYLSLEGLERAKLIDPASRFSEYLYVQFPNQSGVDANVLQKEIERVIVDPAIRVRGPKESSEQVGRTLNYLNDFLGLVSLVALFLSSVGLYYLYRSYLHQRREDMAILATLGLKVSERFRLYLIHLWSLGLASVLVSWLVCLALFPLLNLLLAQFLPFEMPVFAGGWPFLLPLIVTFVGNTCLALPLLIPTLRLRPSAIFQSLDNSQVRFQTSDLLLGLPWILFYWLLSVHVAHSWIIGSSFVAVFLVIGLILLPLGHLLLNFLGKRAVESLSLRLILRSMSRFKLGTLSLILSLVFGTLLLTMVPTIEHNLRQEIDSPESARLPSLFMFDIQEEQVDRLKRLVSDQGVELRGLSPMIISRLESINGNPFTRELDEASTREEEQEQRMRNRGVNLTFRAELDDSEKILRGRSFSGAYDWDKGGPAEVTVERRYAKRLGLSLGDELRFNVYDMPIDARVVGIREVRWTSFMPNFFMVFQPGLLDDAPKTYIAVVPSLSAESKLNLQREIVDELPNVSLIDVAQVIERVLLILEQMGVALQSMAWLSVAVGFFVLYSLVQHQMQMRERDITLLKVLGMPHKSLRVMVRQEFFILSFFSSCIGGFFSVGVTFVFAHLFFDGLWSFNPWPILGSIAAVTTLSLVVAEFASRRSLEKNPQLLLQEGA